MKSRSDPVMFVILVIALTFSQGLTMVSYGKDFITAFPENVAYFYPNTSIRSLRVTALHDATTFTVHFNNTEKTSSSLMSGQTANVTFPKTAEVHQLNYSSKSLRITSRKDIVVHAFSQTDIGTATNPEKSIQTYVVQPITNLGTSYMIPSLTQSDIIQTFGGSPALFSSQRYGSFKLIIINAENTENNITLVKIISGSVQEETFRILPYQLIQMQANASLFKVKSSRKVAVMLTHPCLENTISCKCNMIVNQILPVRFQGQNFVVPNIPGIPQSRLLMTSNKATSLYNNDVQLQPSPSGLLSLSDKMNFWYITASGNVSLTLINPGFIIELIPEHMFAGCYLLQLYSDIKKALVIAETASKTDLRQQNSPVTNAQWNEITGTKYSSTIIPLTEQFNTIIWHPTSKIAVYIQESTGTTGYGGPAIPINEQPDENGCVAIPGQFEVGSESLSWAESLAHCTNLQKHLACPTSEDIQMDLADTVDTTEDEEAWIGLRRSLMTTEWYWQRQTPSRSSEQTSSSTPVNYVHWDDGQPQEILKGLCASLSLNQDDGFKWKSAKCCKKKRPVCYNPRIYLNSLPVCDPVCQNIVM